MSNINKIKELLKQGWRFKYEPETSFIGMYHDKGGKKSICEMRQYCHEDNLIFGEVIADYLNSLK
jgi:hypothetical protein